MQQAQYLGPVMVNGQMMNLWSMSDFKSFVSDVSNAVNDVAQVGADLIDTTRGVAQALGSSRFFSQIVLPVFASRTEIVDCFE